MNKKSVDKPLTEKNFPKIFQKVFEPYALAIQQDSNAIRSDISDLQDGQQRIEQRQIAEIKRKDFLSLKLTNHEKRIVSLEKNSTG